MNENIEFRPLSQGLGFHQKKQYNSSQDSNDSQEEDVDLASFDLEPAKKPSVKTSLASRTFEVDSASLNSVSVSDPKLNPSPLKMTDEMASLTPVWMKPSEERYNPWAGDVDIGREPTVDGVVEGNMENATVIDNPFFVPQKMGSPVEVVTLRFSGYDGLKKNKFKPVLGSMTAMMMDVLTLLSMCMIFTAVVLTAIGESVTDVLVELPADATQRSYFLGMLLTVGFMYLVLARCFAGRTVGEWMFHLQLGSDEDQKKASYPIKVLIRTVIVFLSGFIVFPILSRFANKDLLAYFSGVEMHGEVIQKKA